MDKIYFSKLFMENFSSGSDYFTVSYREKTGTVLHGLVKEISSEHFEVLVQEKDVIIHCKKDGNEVLSCKLNSSRNPEWVDGISEEVGKAIELRK